MDQSLLLLKNIRAGYDDKLILHEVGIEVNRQEIVALMGPNGAGKSTALKAAFGLIESTYGSIDWKGETIKPVPETMVALGMAYVPQGRRVFRHLTVEENLEIGGYVLRNKTAIRQRLRELYEVFPLLKEKRRASSGSLSGGQQQVLAIARGLMTQPELLLLDEPTLGLSPKMVQEVFGIIKGVHEVLGTAMVVVEHNLKSLLHMVDRAYVLDHGKVVAHDTPQQLVERQVLERVFMGRLQKID